MNPFESGQRKVIPAVLIYPRYTTRDRDEFLMLHRNSPDRPGDYHAGKWNGLGGKLELNESPLQAAVRELHEESGLSLPSEAFRPVGVLLFPNFKAHKNEDWHCTVFEAQVSERVQSAKGPEGELYWVRSSELLELPLWPGDRYFLPRVIERKPFLGTIWYQGQDVLKWEMTAI